MIRQWSDHETVSPQPASQPRLLFTLTASILNGKIKHFALRLSFQISPKTAPATKNDTATSPNTAPVAQNDSHDQTSAHMKRYLQCAKQHMPLSNLTKYCACHKKWFSWSNLFTHETLFTMRRATDATLQPHQILRLPRKITIQKSKRPLAKTDETSVPMRDRSENDPKMIRQWSDHETVSPQPASQPRLLLIHAERQHFLWKNTTFRAPAIFPNFTQYCTCHEKWHSNITKYCTCHEKWHLWLILVTLETWFPMREATGTIVQLHRILYLPRKMNVMTNPLRTWHAIDNVLYFTLRYSTLLYSTLLYSSLLYSTLLYSTLLYSTLRYSTLLYATLPDCTLHYSTLLYTTRHYSTLHYSAVRYSTLLYSTLRYSTLTLLYSTLLYTQLYSTLLYTLLYCMLLDSTFTLLYFTLLYFTLLYFTLLYFTLLYFTLLYFTLLYFTLLYFTLLYFTLLYFTLLYFTLLYFTLLYSTLLYSTLLYSTLLYSTLRYSTLTLLYSTLLCAMISEVSQLNFLW